LCCAETHNGKQAREPGSADVNNVTFTNILDTEFSLLDLEEGRGKEEGRADGSGIGGRRSWNSQLPEGREVQWNSLHRIVAGLERAVSNKVCIL